MPGGPILCSHPAEAGDVATRGINSRKSRAFRHFPGNEMQQPSRVGVCNDESCQHAEMKRMNDIERNLKGTALGSVYLAADGSGTSGTPRDDEPQHNGLDLSEMLEMGLESLLMHFRRKPEEK